MAQQRTITEQKRLLKEQQDIISELQEKQNLLELKQEAGKAEQLAVQLKPSASQNVIKTRYLPRHLSHTRNPKATFFIKIELGLLCVTNKFIVEKGGIVILEFIMADAFCKRERNPQKETFVNMLFIYFTVMDQKDPQVKATPDVQPRKNMTVVWPVLTLHYEVRFT